MLYKYIKGDNVLPHVSVVIPVCEMSCYVVPAIDSILNQTFQDFEIILCINGPEALAIESELRSRYGASVRTVTTVIRQLANALNLGINESRAPFIARMDSDDIADKERLALQLNYLKTFDLDLVGCDLLLINESGDLIGSRRYPKGKLIDYILPFKNPFAHNTVIYKKDIVLKVRGYNSGFNSEDYDLWLRLRKLGVRWENMFEELVSYRIHTNSVQRKKLGYAEVVGYSAREFVMNKSFVNFVALKYNFMKSIFRFK